MAIAEYSVVRTRVPKRDDHGAWVPAGAEGTVVHVPPAQDCSVEGTAPVQFYIVEIQARGATDLPFATHLVEVVESEVEVVEALA